MKRTWVWIGASATVILAAMIILDWRIQVAFAIKTRHSRMLSDLVKSQGRRILPYLRDALDDSDWTVRTMTVWSLDRYEGDIDDVVPLLRDCLRDRDIHVRAGALQTITNLGPESNRLMPDLIKLIDTNTDDSMVRGAMNALYQMGQEARSALPSLIDLERRRPDFKPEIEQVLEFISRQPEA